MENIFRIELNIIGILIVCVVIWLFYHQIKTRTRENKIFLRLAYITIIELVLDSIFWMVDCRQFAGAWQINLLVNTFYYLFQILQCYAWLQYCQIDLGCKITKAKRFLLSLPMHLGIILLIANLWNGRVFSVSVENVYRRGWGLWGTMEAACCLFYGIYSIILVAVKMLSKDTKRKQDGKYLVLVSAVPIVSSIIQMLVYGLNFIWIGMAVALLLILIEIEVKQYQEIQQQLTQQKIQIMLSQIQPHFLYNALLVIQNLCHGKAPDAEQATIDFSQFLRGNLDSLSAEYTISFEQELKHVKNYLSLQKYRFEERLHVEYDIQTMQFRLPALTLQPIVENAVRYGIMQKEEGGTVWISTKENETDYEIVIRDDGVGFDVMQKKRDGRSHIGIQNVKDRLEKLCGGTLEIESIEGKGTMVTIKIHKEQK